MTDKQAMERYTKAFGGLFPAFSTDYWDKLHQGTQWMIKTFPQSEYTELCERYLRACLEIVSIEEIVKRNVDMSAEGGRWSS